MENKPLQSILLDFETGKLDKYQAYELILILFKDQPCVKELLGYLFNGKFYKDLDELKGFTMSEDNQPKPVYSSPHTNNGLWLKVGDVLPSKHFHESEVLVKIDHNCGYMVVLWDNNNKRFMPRSYYNLDIAKNIITGISHWCEIKA